MISRIADAVTTIDGLVFLLAILFGVGALFFLAMSWIVYFASDARYFLAAVVALGSALLGIGAVFRVPLALVGVFGSAAAVAAAYGVGVQGILLP